MARVGFWSLQENDSAIVCHVLHLRDAGICDEQFKGTRVAFADCPAYFEAVAAKRPVVADRALTHPATRDLAEGYLRPLGISSMLDTPVWVRGEVVGVLCHEHIGAPRDWSAEEIDVVSALAAMVSLALEESSRAHSEHLLREREERFSKAFHASPGNITILRLSDKKFIEANDAFVRWFGLSMSCAHRWASFSHPPKFSRTTTSPSMPFRPRARRGGFAGGLPRCRSRRSAWFRRDRAC